VENAVSYRLLTGAGNDGASGKSDVKRKPRQPCPNTGRGFFCFYFAFAAALARGQAAMHAQTCPPPLEPAPPGFCAGAKPGEIPVQQPTKFDLAINLTTVTAVSRGRIGMRASPGSDINSRRPAVLTRLRASPRYRASPPAWRSGGKDHCQG
jgi:hypothetical protein